MRGQHTPNAHQCHHRRLTGPNSGQWAGQQQRRRCCRVSAVPAPAELAQGLQAAVDAAAAYAGPLEPAVSLVGGDLVNVVDLQPTAAGVARLAVRLAAGGGLTQGGAGRRVWPGSFRRVCGGATHAARTQAAR